MWSSPLSALIVAYILYQEVSYPGLIGIAAVFVVVPIQCEFRVTIELVEMTHSKTYAKINLKYCALTREDFL